MSIFFALTKMAFSLFSFINRSSIFALFFIFSSVANSAVVEGLFSTVLEVPSQQSSDRDSAFNDALVRVLLKVSGNRSLVEQNEFISRFFPAEQYVVSYAYKENPVYTSYLNEIASSEKRQNPDQASASQTDDSKSISSKPLPFLLEVNFSAKALEKNMISFGVPIWGNVRPTMLVWVALEEDGRRQLLGKNNTHLLLNDFDEDANRFALPIIFPEGDDLDRSAVNISNLWGLFPDAIEQAKTRYVADGHLMIRVYKSLANTWNANWHMSVSGASYSASVSDVDLATVSETVISYMARVMADRFAIQPGQIQSDNQLLIEVTDVTLFKDYIEIQDFLDKLAPVKSVSINWIEGTTMSLSLDLNSEAAQFFEYLKLSGKFIRLNSQADSVSTEPKPRPLSVDMNAQAEGSLSPDFEFVPRAVRFRWLKPVSDVKPQ